MFCFKYLSVKSAFDSLAFSTLVWVSELSALFKGFKLAVRPLSSGESFNFSLFSGTCDARIALSSAIDLLLLYLKEFETVDTFTKLFYDFYNYNRSIFFKFDSRSWFKLLISFSSLEIDFTKISCFSSSLLI